jgi:hypothetical protein
MQSSFVFRDEGGTSILVDADVDIMMGVIKLLMKMLLGRQMLVVPVYISGAGCESHRAMLLVGSSDVTYYDPSGGGLGQSIHHRERGAHILTALRDCFDNFSGTTFSSAAGEDDACPQGALEACNFNCNALCMLLVVAASLGGVSRALPTIRVLRRLGVKVMDCLSAILPTALTKLASEYDPLFERECSEASTLGGWIPTKVRRLRGTAALRRIVAWVEASGYACLRGDR